MLNNNFYEKTLRTTEIPKRRFTMLNSNYTHLAPTIPWGYENALFKLNYHRKETKQYYKRVPLAYVQESPAFYTTPSSCGRRLQHCDIEQTWSPTNVPSSTSTSSGKMNIC